MARLLSAGETETLLGGISRTTLWRLEQSGELVPIRVGRRVLYKLEDVEAFIDRQAAESRTRKA